VLSRNKVASATYWGRVCAISVVNAANVNACFSALRTGGSPQMIGFDVGLARFSLCSCSYVALIDSAPLWV
jgi:hypothetical protein